MEFTVNNKAKEFMKNIPKAEVVTLKEQERIRTDRL